MVDEIPVAMIGLYGVAVGAIVGGAFSILSTYLSNRHSEKKEREQRLHERESERERWLREKLQEIYINCIDSLSKVEQLEQSAFKNAAETIDYSEVLKWLHILLIYYPDRNSNEYYDIYDRIIELGNKRFAGSSAKEMRETIIEMAAKDQRLQGDRDIKPYSAIYWVNMGKNLYDEEYYEKSIEYFNKAIELDPKYISGWENKARSHVKIGDNLRSNGRYEKANEAYEEAIIIYGKVLEMNPDNASYWSDKGYVLNRLGRYEEGIKACNKAIEKDPEAIEAWINKGYSLYKNGSYEAAVKIFDQILERNPQYSKVLCYKGAALQKWDRHHDAFEAYETAGTHLLKAGLYLGAINAFEKALELDASFAETWKKKGDALSATNQNAEAINAYDRALKIDPSFIDALEAKGDTLLNLGHSDEALDIYEKFLEIDPHSERIKNKKKSISKSNSGN